MPADSIVTASRNEVVYEEAGQDLVLCVARSLASLSHARTTLTLAPPRLAAPPWRASTPSSSPTARRPRARRSSCPATSRTRASSRRPCPTSSPTSATCVLSLFSCVFRSPRGDLAHAPEALQHPEKEFLLRASYLEIYNESLKDLLDPTAGPLKVRQDEQKRFFVHPLREEVVTTEAQVAALLSRGADNRHVGQTDFNERSSRSHSVFQMVRSRSSPSPALMSSALTPSLDARRRSSRATTPPSLPPARSSPRLLRHLADPAPFRRPTRLASRLAPTASCA